MSRCPACGADIPGGFAFCGSCGAPLTTPLTGRRDERKVVTVLFCDLVGFTASSDRADPEDVAARLRPYHNRVRRDIERFGGTMEKFVGDAVMGVFGAPTAHEDDPERAVHAGLRILGTVAELNATHPALELSVRIGVATGEAVASLGARPERGEGIVIGDVVNTAARLQAVAPVGGVVVSKATFRATRKVFDYQVLTPVRVKGKADPVAIWRAVASHSRFGVDIDPRAVGPLVGRDVELEFLDRVWGRSVRESSARLVTLVGEAGVGKSRLVQEFGALVDARPQLVTWRQGRCLPYGEGVTFWGLGEVVKAEAGILESDDAATASRKLGQAVERSVDSTIELDWLKSRLAPLVGLVGMDGVGTVAREESFTAWRRFLEAVAAKRPLVVVLEDLHWADTALLDFICDLVERAGGVALMVICTARPELYERTPNWAGRLRNSTSISLAPLSDGDTERLLASLLGEGVLSGTIRTTLLERVGGNPLYAEEVCRMLVERGAVRRDGRTVQLAEGADIDFPESIQALIAARLDTLTPERKMLLQDAAVLGKVFWAGALCAIGDRDRADVTVGLLELAKRELVRPARNSSVQGETEYAFWHVLTRDVAYGQVPRAARSRKHVAAAAWIEQLAGERVADHAESLAYHYSQALAFSKAADPNNALGELEACARRFLILAGDRAMDLDVTRADHHYQRALELVSTDDPERPAVLAKAAEAVRQTGRLLQAERLYEQAVEASQTRGDLLAGGHALVRYSNVLWFRGETVRSLATLTTAVELLEREPRGPELAWAYAERASHDVTLARTAAALEWADKAIALARQIGADEARQRALRFRGVARTMAGDLNGLTDLRKALQLGLQLGLTRATASTYGDLTEELLIVEGPLAAHRTYEVGLEYCKQRGIQDITTWLRTLLLALLYDLGDWDQLLTIADEILAWHEARGGGYDDILVESQKARVHILRDEQAAAHTLVERFLPRARANGDPQILVAAFPVAALVAQGRGDLAASVGLAEELHEATRDGPGSYRAIPLPDLVRICVAAHQLPLAERLIDGIDVRAARLQHCVLTGRAVLTEASGDLHSAHRLYADAAEQWRSYGCLPEHAHALLGTGRCLARLAHHEARDRLLEARAIFARLGARSLRAKTEGWLVRRSTNPGRDEAAG
jgi:class 3 adenylate cyclase/tetratricopeptide (TPR) repeat protein